MDLFAWGERRSREAIAPPAQRPGKTPANQLPDDFLAVAETLRHRRGQASAITAWEIAKATGIKPDGSRGSRERYVRELLEKHFLDLPFLIVADRCGFYRPESADDVSHYHRNLRSRLRCLAVRIYGTRRLAQAEGYSHQGQGNYI